MLYLLDVNIIITAERDYYAIDQVPEYWEWLIHHAEAGRIKMPYEIISEAFRRKGSKNDTDPLLKWVKAGDTEKILTLNEHVDSEDVQYVTDTCYGRDLKDAQLEKIGRDPFLVAYAKKDPSNRTVVTWEGTAQFAQPQNRKIPDACEKFNIKCIKPSQLNRELGFSTSWKSRLS